MATRRFFRYFAAATLTATICPAPALSASDTWDSVDQKVQPSVYRVNVAIKAQVKGNQYAQLAALSPRQHYPVFVTIPKDQGFRVVGSGSCFAVKTNRNDGTYFLTNRHVVDFADGMLQECARFYAALGLYAERTAAFSTPQARYQQLVRVVNLAMKKDISSTEKQMYQATVDSIWETYDNHLSVKADPSRQLFKKYLLASGFKGASGYFIHRAGPSSNAPIDAQIYKKAEAASEPDLAVLFSKAPGKQWLDLETKPPQVGDVIQAIGYPIIKQSGVSVPKDYQPAFTTGRVKKVSDQLIQFEAPVSKGDSGGPLITAGARVVGVVVRRALDEPSGKGNTKQFASAVSVNAVRAFVPELFKR